MEVTFNKEILQCPKKQTWIEDLEIMVNISHASVWVNPYNNNPEIFSLEVGPYDITMWDTEDAKKTRICTTDWRDGLEGPNQFEKHLITLEKALYLPWHDTQEVVNRIKMYLVFS
jgi:hypothetical protein